MEQMSQQPADERRAVALTMSSLESLASLDWDSACRQMIALYPIASDEFCHDVCDSIDLWIEINGLLPGLVDHLTKLILHETDASLKRHYQEWLDSKRSVAGDPDETS